MKKAIAVIVMLFSPRHIHSDDMCPLKTKGKFIHNNIIMLAGYEFNCSAQQIIQNLQMKVISKI